MRQIEPNTTYEARIQGKKKGFFGEYSEITKFATPPRRVVQCGALDELATFTPGKPLNLAIKGMTIQARGMEITLLEAESLGGGYFKGKGMMPIYYLAGASFGVKFDRIYIDENLNVQAGRINIASRSIEEFTKLQQAKQSDKAKEKLQEVNRDKYAQEGVEFYEDVFVYDQIAIAEVIVLPNGEVVIKDDKGESHPDPKIAEARAKNPTKAIIIEDKNGDQVIIKKDGTVEKVSGGGLKGGNNLLASSADLNLIKKALKELRKVYDDQKIAILKADLSVKKKILEDYIKKVKIDIGANEAGSGDLSNIIMLEEELVEDSEIDQEHLKAATEHKIAEKAFNKGIIIMLFANETNSKEEFSLIFNGLIIKGKNAADYISEQKKAGTEEAKQIQEIKESILVMIDGVLNRNSN